MSNPVRGFVAALLLAAAFLAPVACAESGAAPAAYAESGATPAPGAAVERLHALFDEFWAWVSREFPEDATLRGDDRYNDRVTDWSQAAIDRRKAYRADLLARLRRVDAGSIAGQDLGAWTLPGGAAYYDALIAQRTTTTLSAKEIHAIGLSEVARISQALDATMRRTGFQGTRRAFIRFLHDDPQFYYTRAEDMLAGYRDIAKRADAELPKLFAVLPRLTYGVRAMEAFEGNNAEHYTPGSVASGRAGYFEANTNDLRTRSALPLDVLEQRIEWIARENRQ